SLDVQWLDSDKVRGFEKLLVSNDNGWPAWAGAGGDTIAPHSVMQSAVMLNTVILSTVTLSDQGGIVREGMLRSAMTRIEEPDDRLMALSFISDLWS
ncbi:MAG: hypothetical protein CMM00_00365, partial [Rhodopirellula sp.]|nr:hypothetical protein [Rhodopirellula sp.]